MPYGCGVPHSLQNFESFGSFVPQLTQNGPEPRRRLGFFSVGGVTGGAVAGGGVTVCVVDADVGVVPMVRRR